MGHRCFVAPLGCADTHWGQITHVPAVLFCRRYRCAVLGTDVAWVCHSMGLVGIPLS